MTRVASLRAWTVPEDIDAPVAPLLRPATPAPIAAVGPTPIGPTPADVAAAGAEGYTRGVLDGRAAAEARGTAALEAIAQALGAEEASAQALREQAIETLGELVFQAVAAAFPSLEDRHGPADAAAFVRRVLPGLAREPRISIRVGPGAHQPLDGELASLPDEFRSRIDLQADPALASHDVRLVWKDGLAARDGATIHADLLAALGLVAADHDRPIAAGDQT